MILDNNGHGPSPTTATNQVKSSQIKSILGCVLECQISHLMDTYCT